MASAPSARFDAIAFEGPPPPASLRPRFGRMMTYLESLPDGIHSYPQCQGRSGILQTFLERRPPPVGGELEPWVVDLLRPSPRAYVREVVLNAAILAMADAGAMSDAQFLDWNRAANRELYRGLLYRALMAIFTPLALLERAPGRWENFHPGTTLTVRSTGPREAVGTLVFPDRLYDPLLLQMLAGTFTAAFEHARGKDVTMNLRAPTATSAEFVARWG